MTTKEQYLPALRMGDQEVKEWADDTPVEEFKNWVRNGKARHSIEILIFEHHLHTVRDLKNLPSKKLLQTPALGQKTANEIKRLLGGTGSVPYSNEKLVS